MKELQVSIPGSDKWNCLAAEKLQDRMRGLLGRIGLKHGTTMLLAPCSSVHTFGMKFAIDVIFLDKDNRIIKVARNVPKNRIVYGGIRAKKVLEAESGWLPDLPLGIKVAGLQ
ncbi:MAG: DUF192 domain-containing protein [Lentisphaerae bacterium]|jgi:uncharacterized membrane protein (UPF0127 family)|nr:DUF192 domain-containing protein [Lentisphaerota bacterium]